MKAFPRSAKALAVAAASAGLFLFGCWNSTDSNGTNNNVNGQDTATRAIAHVRGYTDTAISGNVLFESTVGDSLFIHGAVSGLTPGKTYGVHVSQFANCSSPDAGGSVFGSTTVGGGGLTDTVGVGARGNLPNLVTDLSGVGHFQITTRRLALRDSAGMNDSASRSVYGHSVVIDSISDSSLTQLIRGTSTPIACGVIVPFTNGTDTTGAVDTTKTPGQDTTGTGTPGHPGGGTTGVY
jgi:Cu/Zn superoxide dismutase